MPVESKTSKRGRMAAITEALHQTYPDADCALLWSNALELLVATILSAQATDTHVNQVTPGLFRKYTCAADFAAVPLEALQEDVKSIGLFRNKSKFIKGACQALVADHGGDVPRTLDELLSLPGVARKTANVVLGTAFGIASGIVVDTHVNRLAKRMGFARTKEKDTNKVEKALMGLAPESEWVFLGHALIAHGRQVCPARKPGCPRCPLTAWCPKRGVDKTA